MTVERVPVSQQNIESLFGTKDEHLRYLEQRLDLVRLQEAAAVQVERVVHQRGEDLRAVASAKALRYSFTPRLW